MMVFVCARAVRLILTVFAVATVLPGYIWTANAAAPPPPPPPPSVSTEEIPIGGNYSKEPGSKDTEPLFKPGSEEMEWEAFRVGDSGEWLPFDRLKEMNPPYWPGEYTWFRSAMPGILQDSYLMMTGVDYHFEIYIGDTLIHRHGDLTRKSFTIEGAQPLFIHLPPSPDPFILTMRTYTPMKMNELGAIKYGSLDELKMELVRKHIDGMILLALFFSAGLLALGIHAINREHESNVYFALFALTIGLKLLFDLPALDLFFDLSAVQLHASGPVTALMIYTFIEYFIRVLHPPFARTIRLIGQSILSCSILYSAALHWLPDIVIALDPVLVFTYPALLSAASAICLRLLAPTWNKRNAADVRWFGYGFSCFFLINLVAIPFASLSDRFPGWFGAAASGINGAANLSLNLSVLLIVVYFSGTVVHFASRLFRHTRTQSRRLNEQNIDLQRMHLQLEQWNATLESQVEQRTLAIRNLLDEAGQGFLSVSDDLLIMPEYSVECERLLGPDLTGQPLFSLVYAADMTDRGFFEELMRQVIGERDEVRAAMLLSLLPGEVRIGGRHVELQCKKLAGEAGMPERVMVIMTDVSDRRQLETAMEQERRMLRMVVHVVAHYAIFKELTEDYKQFAAAGIRSILTADAPPADKIDELMRHAHTFKGNWAQLDFMAVVEKLHDFETQLLEWRQKVDDREDKEMPPRFAEWLAGVDCFAWLEADMQVLRDMLGDRFADQSETVWVKKEKLVQLQRTVAELFPTTEGKRIVEELRRLGCKPMRDLLSIYPDYVQRLAEKLGKSVYPMSIEGGKFAVDHERYLPLVRSFSHIFSNMVDHGIETPEARASFGKEKFGTISCRIDATDGDITIVIANDGSVIDTADIRRIALDKGLATATEFDAAAREEQLLFIFRDSFSTKRTISPVSGRGFGLSAVKHAVEVLHGEVSVASDTAQGTVFRFKLPNV